MGCTAAERAFRAPRDPSQPRPQRKESRMRSRPIRLAFLLLAAALTPAAPATADEAKVLRLALSDIAYLDPQSGQVLNCWV